MNAVVVDLTRRGLFGRRRAVLLALLPALLLLLAAAVRWASEGQLTATIGLIDGLAFGTLLPLMCLMIGTGVIATEIDDGSIVYLLAKPIARRTIVMSKLAVAWPTALVLGAAPIMLATQIAGDDATRLTTAYGVAAALAALAYTTVFVALSVASRNAVIIGLLYALLWEGVLAGWVPGVRNVSIRQWALAAAERVLGDRAEGWGITSDVGLVTGLVLLAVTILGAAVLATRRLQTLRLTAAE